MKSYLLFISGMMMISIIQAQDQVLESYIREGIESNLALKQKTLDWQFSIYELREARGLFYPEISLNARYTVADGGRMIEFPVGDLLNDVYSTLNSLIMSDVFPQVENQEFAFLRPTEHETKIRLVQPVLNTDIYYNRKIRINRSDALYANAQVYKRELVKEIKTAYYEYLKLLEINRLLGNTRNILEENVRVHESLYRNDKITKDVLLRSRTELMSLDDKIAGVEKGLQTSKAYFNFLLNRGMDEEISPSVPGDIIFPVSLDMTLNESLGKREELAEVDSYIKMAENNIRLTDSGKYPEMFTVIDYGFQGEKYSFTKEDDYVLASMILQWDIFSGFQNRNKLSKARVDLDKIKNRRAEVEKMISLEITGAWYELAEIRQRLESEKSKVELEREVFRLVSRKNEQGMASQLEYLNARNSMTASEQEYIVTKYELLIAYAVFEKSIAGFKFNLDYENN